MTSPLRAQRARTLPRLAVGATAVLLTVGTAALAPASQAVAPVLPSETMAQAIADTADSSTCSASDQGPNAGPTGAAYTLGQTAALSASNAVTLTNTNDSTDTVALSSRTAGRVTSKVVGGTVSSIGLSGSGSTTVTAAKGAATACESEIGAIGGIEVAFTLTKPRWVTATATSGTPSTSTFIVVAGVDSGTGTFDVSSAKGTSTSHHYLPAGSYEAVLEGGIAGSAGSAISLIGFGSTASPANGTHSATYSTKLAFSVPGAASTAVQGDKKLAALPGTFSCTTHKATLKWKKDAAKAGKVKVSVTGKKAKTIKKPKANKKYVLAGIPGTKPVTITVRAGGKTIKRSYEACS